MNLDQSARCGAALFVEQGVPADVRKARLRWWPMVAQLVSTTRLRCGRPEIGLRAAPTSALCKGLVFPASLFSLPPAVSPRPVTQTKISDHEPPR